MKKSEKELWEGGAKTLDSIFKIETLEKAKTFPWRALLMTNYAKGMEYLKGFKLREVS